MSRSAWLYASKKPSFFGVPFLSLTPLLYWVHAFTSEAFLFSLLVMAVCLVLVKMGWGFKVLWNRLLHRIRGDVVYARPWWYRNRFRDY